MSLKRFTGPAAGSQKYDLLTALAVAGLNGTPGFQTSMLRLVALVTARYNWARNELTVGQKDLGVSPGDRRVLRYEPTTQIATDHQAWRMLVNLGDELSEPHFHRRSHRRASFPYRLSEFG